ncbi:MAG: thiol reductant ABC exporter subunit CydD [Wenzhouxiangella sp.]
MKVTPATNPPAGQRLSASRWLTAQAPRWLAPSAAGLAVLEAILVIAQAGLIAWLLYQAAVLIPQQQPGTDLLSASWPALAWLAAVLVGRASLVGLRGSLMAEASAAVRERLRSEVFMALSAAGPGLRGRQGTGYLLNQLIEQIEALDAFYGRYLPQQWLALLIPLTILLAVFSQNWLAGLLLALSAPLIPLFMALVGMGAEQLSQQQQTALGRLAGLFHDRLRGLDTLKRFGAGQREGQRLADFSEQFRQRTMAVLRLAFLSSAVLEFFAAVAIATLAIYIGLGLLGLVHFGPTDSLSLGTGLFILLLAPEFFAPLRTLAQHWHDRADALAAADDLREQLDRPPARRSPERPADIPTQTQPLAIHAQAIHFAWSGRAPLFENLSLYIRAGEFILIEGPSGGGKSTLLMLLAGLLSPDTSGANSPTDRSRLAYGPHDLAQLDDLGLSHCRVWMGQQALLFPGSLADNVRFGRSDLDDSTIRSAIERAGLADFIDHLPQGLDTRVGENGQGLSGGQAQRLALARVLADARPILFLDEPTASLDSDSEQAFFQALMQARKNQPMTIVCASHSPGARRWADRRLHLSTDGRLAEVDRTQ